MAEDKDKQLPERRKKGIVVRELRDEVLVYDLERHRAHCLNHTAAMVWKRCDGKSTIGEITLAMNHELRSSVDEEIVWQAVIQLAKNNLLSERIAKPTIEGSLSRREVLRKIGITTAVLLPAVISIVAPTAAHAQSCTSVDGDKCGPAFPPCCPPLTCVRISANLCQCSQIPGDPCS